MNPDIDIHFTYQGTKSEFDDVFVQENVIVLCEYTAISESGISGHLKNKKILYDKINADPAAFIAFLRTTYPKAETALKANVYKDYHYRVIILYCSVNTVKPALKAEAPGVIYFDYHKLQYFRSIAGIIRRSARSEFLAFIQVEYSEFGSAIIKPSLGAVARYEGSLLPEAHSGFPAGFKVVSFYADAEALLEHCYVLRKDGWRDETLLYQRMISRPKLESMRKHLTTDGRVFVNNIVATLPADTVLTKADGTHVSVNSLTSTTTVRVEIPNRYNCVGLVDGQHRVLSYYKGGAQESEIAPLRQLQNLLLTGIVYPPGITEEEKIRFEARLFLEINSKQTVARPEIRQAIALLLNPWESGSIAREVVNRLNEVSGSVGGEFEKYFYDKGKLKVASIAAFGVRPLVKLSGTDSAFHAWSEPEKERLKSADDDALRAQYVAYTAGLIDIVLGAIKANVDGALWTRDRKVPGRLLTTTTVNGAIALLRLLIENGHAITFSAVSAKLKGLVAKDISKYKSSQYNRLGQDLYDKYFV